MRLIELESLTSTASTHAHNEDALCLGDNMAVVLDGATGLRKNVIPRADSDAAWLAAELARSLPPQWEATRNIAAAMSLAGDRVASRFERIMERVGTRVSGIEVPSVGLIAASVEHGELLIHRLGDCSAFLLGPDGAKPILPPSPLEALDAKSISELNTHLRAGKSYHEARAAIMPTIEAHRALANQPGGYSVFRPEVGCAERLESRPVAVTPGQRLLLCSDGFAALFAYLPAEEHAALFDGESCVLDTALDRLRAIEEDDADMLEHPRLKPQDDATAVLMRIGE